MFSSYLVLPYTLFRYLFTAELDLPYDVVFDVIKPPDTTEERLKWDKSIKHFACVEKLRDVGAGFLLR